MPSLVSFSVRSRPLNLVVKLSLSPSPGTCLLHLDQLEFLSPTHPWSHSPCLLTGNVKFVFLNSLPPQPFNKLSLVPNCLAHSSMVNTSSKSLCSMDSPLLLSDTSVDTSLDRMFSRPFSPSLLFDSFRDSSTH